MPPASAPWSAPPETFRGETRRGAEGFFHVAQSHAGQWWLRNPEGRPEFLRAVHGVRAPAATEEGEPPRDSAARLRAWGFDAVGVGGDGAGRDDGLAFLATVDFCRAAPILVGPGLRVPDVFDPRWPELAHRRAAEVCTALAGEARLIGWVTDDTPGWAQPQPANHPTSAITPAPTAAVAKESADAAPRPTLLQLCLSLEPGFAAYHAAWEFALALYGGRIEALGRAWGVPLANKEMVRERTRAEKGFATRGYWRDEARWTRELARRYFTTTAAAIRAADPHHLVLGCRFGGLAGPHVLAECVAPAVDVAMPDWREVPGFVTGNGLREGEPAQPLIAGDVCWTAPEFLRLPAAARVLRLTSVEWMLRRARTALERTARHPAAIGYAWRQWQDEPGEQPPFARGLVHANGAEAREHTELLAEFNARAALLRRTAAAKPFPASASSA